MSRLNASPDFTDHQVAQLLQKHPRTIQRWCQEGKLPGCYKAGRSWRIPPGVLRKAGLAKALETDDIRSDFAAAQGVIASLRTELEQAIESKQAPVVPRNWRLIQRSAKQLADDSARLADLASKAPGHFST